MPLKVACRLNIRSERTALAKLIMKLKQFWNMSSFADMLQLILGEFFWATSMLVTDVGPKSVGDNFEILVTDLICW